MIQEGIDAARSIGIGALKPIDQHVHLVEEVLDLDGYPFVLKDWHFGSDMAAFCIDREECPYSKAWAVAVDLEKRKCEISYVLIVNKELEIIVKDTQAQAFAKDQTDQTAAGSVAAFAQLFLRNAGHIIREQHVQHEILSLLS